MNKFTIFFGLLVASALVAGAFGAVLNMLSYTVGASYFHDLKFAQFALDQDLHNRLGAALVGWRESWWMGALIALPVLALGFFSLARPQTLVIAGVAAMGTVILITTLSVVAGLGFGVVRIDDAVVQGLPVPAGSADPVGFARAAVMQDMAYYGSLAGAVIALWTMWKVRLTEGRLYGG